MATNIPQRAFGGLLAGAVADLLTVPNDLSVSRYAITQILLVNTHTADLAATLYHIENGGPSDATRTVFPGATLKSNSLVILNGIFDMEPGDVLRGFAGTADKVNVIIHYIKVVP